MKLTRSDREAFALAVMNDIPLEDYQEQARALILQESLKTLPPRVRAIYDNPETRQYIVSRYTYLCGWSAQVPCNKDKEIMNKALTEKLNVLSDLHEKQQRARNAMRAKVAAVIAGCTTLKQAKERLPEFVKYLPADRDSTGVVNLPAVANLADELTKMGWPKGGIPSNVTSEQ